MQLNLENWLCSIRSFSVDDVGELFFLFLSNVLISLWLISLGLLFCLPHVKTNIANLDIYNGNMLIQLAKHSTTMWTLENRSPLKDKSPHTRQRFTRQPCLTYLTIILIIKSLQSSCASSCHGQNDEKVYIYLVEIYWNFIFYDWLKYMFCLQYECFMHPMYYYVSLFHFLATSTFVLKVELYIFFLNNGSSIVKGEE